MRILVMFDLPTTSSSERKQYRKFRKYLIENGFMMMQNSIYSKLALNQSAANIISNNVKINKPENGLVQILVVTEKQYSRMETILGEAHDILLDTDERLVIF